MFSRFSSSKEFLVAHRSLTLSSGKDTLQMEFLFWNEWEVFLQIWCFDLKNLQNDSLKGILNPNRELLKALFVLKSKSPYGFQCHFSPLILSSMFGFIFLFVVFPSSMLPFILGFCCLMLFYVFWCSSQSFMHKCSIYYKSRDII